MPKMTSIQAYSKHVMEGRATTQRERIYRYIFSQTLSGNTITRSMIAQFFRPFWNDGRSQDGYASIPLASVCGRVNALIKAGLVEVAWVTKGGVRGARVEWLQAVMPAPEQRKFQLKP